MPHLEWGSWVLFFYPRCCHWAVVRTQLYLGSNSRASTLTLSTQAIDLQGLPEQQPQVGEDADQPSGTFQKPATHSRQDATWGGRAHHLLALPRQFCGLDYGLMAAQLRILTPFSIPGKKTSGFTPSGASPTARPGFCRAWP